MKNITIKELVQELKQYDAQRPIQTHAGFVDIMNHDGSVFERVRTRLDARETAPTSRDV